MSDSKKPSTDDILNLLRKSGGGEKSKEPAAEQPSAEAASAPPQVEASGATEPAPSEKPKPADILSAIRSGGGSPKTESAPKPAGTADILAAARAKASAGAGEKPKGTSDILAAARSKGGVAPTASPKEPVAAKPAPQPKADVSGRDPKELVEALRSGKTTTGGGAAVAEAPKKLKLPGAKPVAAAAATEVPRRSFVAAFLEAMLQPFAMGWAVFAFIAGLSGLLVARFMMPNMVLELPSRFKIGPPTDFPPESVSEKFKASRGVWIVNTASYNGDQLIYALASVCTHLGCTPNWLEGEQKFKCPCHGSGFYINGINFEGPAPRPLERVGISVAADGMLEVDKSQKFQEELGQWTDGKSYFSA